MTENEFYAYCAGFFDGEGMVGVTRGGSGRCTTFVNRQFIIYATISNTNRVSLDMIQAKFGGHIQEMKRQKAHHRQAWKWMIRGKKLIVFLNAMLPLTIVKRPDIEIVLQLYAHIKAYVPAHSAKHHGGMLPLPIEELAARQEFVNRLRALPGRRPYSYGRITGDMAKRNRMNNLE